MPPNRFCESAKAWMSYDLDCCRPERALPWEGFVLCCRPLNERSLASPVAAGEVPARPNALCPLGWWAEPWEPSADATDGPSPVVDMQIWMVTLLILEKASRQARRGRTHLGQVFQHGSTRQDREVDGVEGEARTYEVGVPDGEEEGDAGHEEVVGRQVGVIDQVHSMQLSVEPQDLLPRPRRS